jgi:hypothetical protein
VLDREQLQLQRGHHAEVAAAAAQGPEQVLVLVGVGAHLLAVGGHELDAAHRVAGQAVEAAQPADAAAQDEADHAHVGRGPAQGGQAVLAGRGGEVARQRAGLDPRHARVGVDAHAVHPDRAHQHRVVQRHQGARPVTGALGGQLEPVVAGELHRGHDVGDALGQDDRRGVLVGDQVPGLASVMPPLFVRR